MNLEELTRVRNELEEERVGTNNEGKSSKKGHDFEFNRNIQLSDVGKFLPNFRALPEEGPKLFLNKVECTLLKYKVPDHIWLLVVSEQSLDKARAWWRVIKHSPALDWQAFKGKFL